MTEQKMAEIWFPIVKDADGFPKTRDWEGLFCSFRADAYEIQSVPFYVKDVAYGDVVEATRTPEGFLRFTRVLERGGHSVYRIYLHEPVKETETLVTTLRSMGSRVERDGNLIAVAVSREKQDQVVNFILNGRESGRWGAQDGYIDERSEQS